jgi:hypothetical protein
MPSARRCRLPSWHHHLCAGGMLHATSCPTDGILYTHPALLAQGEKFRQTSHSSVHRTHRHHASFSQTVQQVEPMLFVQRELSQLTVLAQWRPIGDTRPFSAYPRRLPLTAQCWLPPLSCLFRCSILHIGHESFGPHTASCCIPRLSPVTQKTSSLRQEAADVLPSLRSNTWRQRLSFTSPNALAVAIYSPHRCIC